MQENAAIVLEHYKLGDSQCYLGHSSSYLYLPCMAMLEFLCALFLDPLGALWPFIGIVIEAIILAIIIIAYEKYRCKKGEKCGRKGKHLLVKLAYW